MSDHADSAAESFPEAWSHPSPKLTHLKHSVLVIDKTPARIHRGDDLLDLILCAVGIGFVLVLAIYAHSTTAGVTEDVRNVAIPTLHRVLLLPVTVFEGLVTLFVPVIVIITLALRRALQIVGEAIATTVVTALVIMLTIWGLGYLPTDITHPLTTTATGTTVAALNVVLAALTTFLTTAGEAYRNKAIQWAWIGLWTIMVFAVIRGSLTLPGALISMLLGRAMGDLERYLVGVPDQRAHTAPLVQGLLRIGIEPLRIVRIESGQEASEMRAWQVHEIPGLAETADEEKPAAEVTALAGANAAAESGSPSETLESTNAISQFRPPQLVAEPAPLVSISEITDEVALGAPLVDSVHSQRTYAFWDTAGRRYDMSVLDPDREGISRIHDLWNSFRLRGLEHGGANSLRATAERGALVKLSAENIGIRTPALVGISQAHQSMILVGEHIPGLRRISDLPDEEISESLLAGIWNQISQAHRHGLSHRAIDLTSLTVDAFDQVWILGWSTGEVAASELAQSIDRAQTLVALAECVGVERALDSARQAFGETALVSLAPLLQSVALPAQMRGIVRKSSILTKLRDSIIERTPIEEIQPVRLTRFSARTAIMAAIVIGALWVLLGSLNMSDIILAVRSANPWWILVAFACGLLTYLGAAIPLVAYTPEKMSLRETIAVQVAASIITLVAPAGIGPAALNLRFLNRKGVSTPLALATVALVQFSQVITTLALLVLLVLVTGNFGVLSMPDSPVLEIIGLVLLILASLLVVPQIRNFLWKKMGPTWQQILPRIIWLCGRPGRLLAGIGGNLLITLSFVGAFGASLAAFGATLDFTTLSITYLASNSIGSFVPSPGGIGPVEAALTGGLQVAGIPAGIAISTALVYRLTTFWGRIPLGFISLRIMERRKLL